MFKKFIEDECNGYTLDIRYDGERALVIVKVTKEDVSVSHSYDWVDLVTRNDMDEYAIVREMRKMLREVDEKFVKHMNDKWGIK